MNFFCAETKLVDLIHTDYHLLPIINRMGVKLGFGDLTVDEVCKQKCIDVEFFLAIVNSYHNQSVFSEDEFRKFPLSCLISYFKKSHEYYRKFVVSRDNKLFVKLIENSYKHIDGIDYIHEVYTNEVLKFVEHMDYEEKEVFPLLEAIDIKSDIEYNEKENIVPDVNDFHENLVDKLYDMTTILMKYMEPDNDDNSSNELLFSIFEFIKDINIHTKIERSILLKYINK